MSFPQSHLHPQPLHTLAPHLLPHLPQSLPLLRRIQFNDSSTSAHTFATFPPDQNPSPPSFSATYVDRSRTPETECWIFSSYENYTSSTAITTKKDDVSLQRRSYAAKAEILALLEAIAELDDGGSALMVLGSLNEVLVELLAVEDMQSLVPQKVVSRPVDGGDGAASNCAAAEGKARGRGVLHSISTPYMKWLIAPPSKGLTHDTSPLPEGCTFSTVRWEELALTMRRTDIPKTEATLAVLGNVSVRYTRSNHSLQEAEAERGELIAWAFLGVDGSLSSLHVEPAHRGRGLAKAVSRTLFSGLVDDVGGMGFRSVGVEGKGEGSDGVDPSRGWACSDVALENRESAGVATGLGGQEGWIVRWVTIDLSKVKWALRVRQHRDINGLGNI